MRLKPAWHRIGVVLGALLFVLAQALTATASSAQADRPHLDAFGNPLCTNDFAEVTGHGGIPPSGLPDCCAHGVCTMACHAGVPALILPDAAGITWQSVAAIRVAVSPVLRVARWKTGYRPGRPRAPPLLT